MGPTRTLSNETKIKELPNWQQISQVYYFIHVCFYTWSLCVVLCMWYNTKQNKKLTSLSRISFNSQSFGESGFPCWTQMLLGLLSTLSNWYNTIFNSETKFLLVVKFFLLLYFAKNYQEKCRSESTDQLWLRLARGLER